MKKEGKRKENCEVNNSDKTTGKMKRIGPPKEINRNCEDKNYKNYKESFKNAKHTTDNQLNVCVCVKMISPSLGK